MLTFRGLFRGLAAVLTASAILSPAVGGAQTQAEAKAPATARIPWLTLEQASKVPPGSVVYLRGNVVSVSPPRPGSKAPYRIYLSDETGNITLVIFQDVWKRIADTTVFEAGIRLEVFGEANDYKGTRQVEVRQPTHLRRMPGTAAAGFSPRALARAGEPSYTPLTIGAINMMTIGLPVRVRGIVAKYEPPTAERVPFRLTVQDDTGSVEVVYWKETAAEIAPDDAPEKGRLVEVSGYVTEHKNKMQLRVDKGSHITRHLEVAKRDVNATEKSQSADSAAGRTTFN